jgi:hypothetical protein
MRSRTITVAALVVCAIALTFFASGCGFLAQKAAEKTIEGATGNKVDINGDKVSVQAEDGTKVEVGGEQKLPEGFPTEVPIYAGAKIVGSTTAAGGESQTSYTVSYLAPDEMAVVARWYTSKLKSGGWKSVMTAQTGDGAIMASERGDLTVNVSVNPSSTEKGFRTQVVVVVGPK